MEELVINKSVKGLNFNKSHKLLPCATRIESKMSQTPLKTNYSKLIKKSLLEIVHSDICGPIDVPLQGEAQYFINIYW